MSISYAPNDPQVSRNTGAQPSAPANATTRVLQVGNVRDDASASAGMNYLFEKYLKVGTRMSGMRFVGANIPPGSTIVKAQLKIYLLSIQLANRLDGLVQAEAVGNAAGFMADGRYLYDLPRTEASVAWIREPGFYGAQVGLASPDISAVVQEVVDRPDWSAGNAIGILFSCTNQPGQDLQFVAYGYCADNPHSCSSHNYPPPVLEITYVP